MEQDFILLGQVGNLSHRTPPAACRPDLQGEGRAVARAVTDTATRDGWLRAPDDQLLSQCRQERFKASGPGGQHRNKVETAVRLTHLPSGVTAHAAETRSTEENRSVALRRLRLRLALTVRSPFRTESPDLPPEFIAQRTPHGQLNVNQRNPAYPVIVACILDALSAAEGSYATAASALGVTTTQLRRFLQSDREVWRALQGT